MAACSLRSALESRSHQVRRRPSREVDSPCQGLPVHNEEVEVEVDQVAGGGGGDRVGER